MHARCFHLLLTLSALLLAISAPIAWAASGDDEEKPILDWNFDEALKSDNPEASVLALGDAGTWSAKIADGQYVVENSKDKDGIRYVHLSLSDSGKPLELSVSSVDVDVEGTFEDEDSGAGVLYRFDPESKTYLAFVLTKAGYMVLRRDDEGFKTLSQGEHSHDEAVTLEVNTRDSGELEFRLDDKVVATIPDPGLKGNDVGMISFARGEFDFDNFQVYSPDAE
jgi:hypothetical protein